MASSLSRWLVDPKKNWFAAQHMKSLSKRLRKYGLRYDDLYDPYYDLDVKEALNRLPREIVDARNQRLKRAMDLSMKHEYLPENLQALSVHPPSPPFSSTFWELEMNSAVYEIPVSLLNACGANTIQELHSGYAVSGFADPFTLAAFLSLYLILGPAGYPVFRDTCPNPASFSNQNLFRLLCNWGSLNSPELHVKKERAERDALGALPLYQRTIP
ncbi:hypothetical protein FEM48_Zijuj06G0148100 [Ziziphus jujuba var. spinosa]|uniref:Complex III subunit VII n=1 Tax=Ziziphus jujuba var. spinosa TaxID=714518 RepID=A0A978V9X2_ZIZJJ|nr:hypothetical protein FEM48_Zijuj06G0148100 [Ziziphus jujuba var. spinosa]